MVAKNKFQKMLAQASANEPMLAKAAWNKRNIK